MTFRNLAGLVIAALSLIIQPSPSPALGLAGESIMKLHAVPYSQVHITDKFWRPRMETTRRVTIPHMIDMLEKTSAIKNFELAASHKTEGFVGPPWTDSDAYKVLEAASYTLAANPDPALESRIDGIIAKISAAQQADGYINTYFQVQEPGARWTDLALKHELYTAGHMFEAAVAHYQATGKRSFLDVAIRMADYVDSIFGDGPGKRIGYPGHPEIELALIKLWQVTGERRYFALAQFFLENRGKGLLKVAPPTALDSVYFLDDAAIRDHKEIKGHAVRALYLFSGATDVAAETRDTGMLDMLDRVWENAVRKRMYITGGVGPGGGIEGFTHDYDLPNLTAYQETCASIGMAMWNQRLGLLHGDARYIDVMETALYNGALAGISLDGRKFFYTNPLASAGNVDRAEWFGCACCPPNIARTIAMIGGYVYAADSRSIWVNLYVGNKAEIKVGDDIIPIKVKTDYPWDGKIRIQLNPRKPRAFEMRLRVPSWCEGATVAVNGEGVASPRSERGYLALSREWASGDTIDLNLPMRIRQVESHPNVMENRGLLALQRGPIVYCLEQGDQTVPVNKIGIHRGAKLRAVKKPGALGGIVVLQGTGQVTAKQPETDSLYRDALPEQSVPVTAIPYYSWDNRGPCPMEVWIPSTPRAE